MTLWNILCDLHVFITRAEQRRLIYQGAVRVDGEAIKDMDFIIPDGSHIVSVGKSKHFKIAIENGLLKKLDN